MCGIAGIVRPGGLTPGDHRTAARFAKLLHHRGPDGSGIHTDGNCVIVQTRLHLTGPLDQPLPLSSPGGRRTIVYNGEVYDHWDDTQAVLDTAEHSLSGLNGMFAFFIWDGIEQTGFAAVDALGIKPFYYAYDQHRFVFSSEAGALVESGAVPFAPDEEAIAEALMAPYFSSAIRLPFSGVHRLPPGHCLRVTRDGCTIERYYRFRYVPGFDFSPDDLAQTLAAAVTANVRADAPVGVFLSGGVDSSLIAALAHRPAWTISYQGREAADYSNSLIVKSDDVPFATRVAEAHTLEHHLVQVSPEGYETALLKTLQTNDLIAAWEQEVSQYLLAEAAARLVRAVLVGDAADETHYGYSFLLNPDRVSSPRRILEFFGAPPLRRFTIADFDCKYRQFAVGEGHTWNTLRNQQAAMSSLIFHLWLTRLLHNGDIHLMAHSLEGRVPFGDLRLLALAQQIPPELGLRSGIEKWHLRTAAAQFLDPEIAWRPKSALTKNLHAGAIIHRNFAQAWRQHASHLEPYVDSDAVNAIALGPAPTTDRESGICFRLLALLTWFQRFAP